MFNIRCLFVGWAFRTDGAAGLARAITHPTSFLVLFFFFIFLLSSFSFAETITFKLRDGAYGGTPFKNYQVPDPYNPEICRGACATYNGNCGSLNSNDFESFFPPGTLGDNPDWGYMCLTSFVKCPEGFTFGNGFCSGPAPNPPSSNPSTDDDGLPLDNTQLEDRLNSCAAAASSVGGKSMILKNHQTGEWTCVIGSIPDFSLTPAAACLQQDGTACYANPIDVGGHDGWQCGTFNGTATCIASAASGALGVGKTPLGTTTTQGQIRFMEDVHNDGTNTTTTTTTITPNTETKRTNAGGSAMGPTEKLDSGSGAASLFQCGDGRLAANSASCDSLRLCQPGQYLAYGTCLVIPTKTSSITKEDTQVKKEVRDNATGQLISTSTTSSSKTFSAGTVSNPSGSGSSAPAGKGECDPTSSDYQECVGLLTSVSDTQAADDKAKNDAAATSAVDSMAKSVEDSLKEENGFAKAPTSFFDRINSSIFTASNSACVAFSITILSFSEPIPCTLFDKFKALFGWFLYLFTTWTIFGIVKKPVER